jgi:PEP-CTERM motif
MKLQTLAAAATLLLSGAALAQGTISSGTTFLSFTGTPMSTGTGNAGLFFGSTSAFATDELVRYGWAYNQGVGTQNRPFSSLDTPTQSYAGNVATFTWNNAGAGTSGFARWNAVLTVTLTQLAPTPGGNAPGQARVDSQLLFISNAANTGAIAFNLFHELDLDIIGTNANAGPGDTYSVIATDGSSTAGRAFDPSGSNFAEFDAANAARYEFNTGSALRTKLGSTSGTGSGNLTTLAGTTAANWASTDGAVAFQWQPTLAPGQSVLVSTSFTINTPVPEPGTWAMLLAGLAVVGRLAARRRS